MKLKNLMYSVLLAQNVKFDNPCNQPNSGCQNFFIDLTIFNRPNTFEGILLYVINLLLGLAGLVAILFIIYGGFQYMTARGDEEQAAAGKSTLTNAIIGLTVIILSFMIVSVINNALGQKY